jgi:hypothetical protein
VSEPKYAQSEGLDVHETEDGLVVYQPATDRVHYLNATAAAVFTLAATPMTSGEITVEVGTVWARDELPAAEVESCLAQLLDEGVLTSPRS